MYGGGGLGEDQPGEGGDGGQDYAGRGGLGCQIDHNYCVILIISKTDGAAGAASHSSPVSTVQ